MGQLEDVRNVEMTGKIASYHVVLEPVTADQLFNSGGIVTEGGEVPAERSVSGGFFGVGGKGNDYIAFACSCTWSCHVKLTCVSFLYQTESQRMEA